MTRPTAVDLPSKLSARRAILLFKVIFRNKSVCINLYPESLIESSRVHFTTFNGPYIILEFAIESENSHRIPTTAWINGPRTLHRKFKSSSLKIPRSAIVALSFVSVARLRYWPTRHFTDSKMCLIRFCGLPKIYANTIIRTAIGCYGSDFLGVFGAFNRFIERITHKYGIDLQRMFETVQQVRTETEQIVFRTP